MYDGLLCGVGGCRFKAQARTTEKGEKFYGGGNKERPADLPSGRKEAEQVLEVLGGSRKQGGQSIEVFVTGGKISTHS